MIKKESKIRKSFQFNKVKFLIGCVVFLLIIVGYLYSKNNGLFLGSSDSQQPTPTITAVEVGCTRTTRLENQPQYDRALSLINQRVQGNLDFWNKYGKNEKDKEEIFKFFPANLTNCIKINEAKLNNDAEGYFILNSKDIKPDYYPVTVDTSYMFTDDVLTALLLTHEITHVQQYIDSVNGKTKLSCLDDEVSAFMSQLDFYLTLNTEENKAVWLRMQEKDNLNPQIQMIKSMIQINQSRDPSLCDFLDKKCRDEYLNTNLKKNLSEDEHYKSQCSTKLNNP